MQNHPPYHNCPPGPSKKERGGGTGKAASHRTTNQPAYINIQLSLSFALQTLSKKLFMPDLNSSRLDKGEMRVREKSRGGGEERRGEGGERRKVE